MAPPFHLEDVRTENPSISRATCHGFLPLRCRILTLALLRSIDRRSDLISFGVNHGIRPSPGGTSRAGLVIAPTLDKIIKNAWRKHCNLVAACKAALDGLDVVTDSDNPPASPFRDSPPPTPTPSSTPSPLPLMLPPPRSPSPPLNAPRGSSPSASSAARSTTDPTTRRVPPCQLRLRVRRARRGSDRALHAPCPLRRRPIPGRGGRRGVPGPDSQELLQCVTREPEWSQSAVHQAGSGSDPDHRFFPGGGGCNGVQDSDGVDLRYAGSLR